MFRKILRVLCYRVFYKFLPDKIYLKILFYANLGYKLNLKNPKTYNEKLQWLKLYDRNPEHTKMVDKYEAKKYIAEKIGEEYIIPTIGVWDSVDDIEFDSLPEQFVLKSTHDSGMVVICRDKSQFNVEKAKQTLRKSFLRNYFLSGREWPYKNIKKRIIAEKFMSDGSEKGLNDYKFYCFNGKPEFAYISQGLEDHSTARINYMTLEWERAPFRRPDYKEFEELPDKPKKINEMLELAAKLSEGIKFLRVDFYEIEDKVYFGELTFFPGSGLTPFQPEEWDYKIGDCLNLI